MAITQGKMLFGMVVLAAASKLAASAGRHQRALSASRDGSQVRALSHKLFGLRRLPTR
jgi:hypothetical protein